MPSPLKSPDAAKLGPTAERDRRSRLLYEAAGRLAQVDVTVARRAVDDRQVRAPVGVEVLRVRRRTARAPVGYGEPLLRRRPPTRLPATSSVTISVASPRRRPVITPY